MKVTPRLRELIEPANPQPGMMSLALRYLLARDVSAEIVRARKGPATPALEALRKTLVTEGIVELTPEESKAVAMLEDAVKETEQVDEVANMAPEIAPARDAFFLAIQRSLASDLEQRSRGEAAGMARQSQAARYP